MIRASDFHIASIQAVIFTLSTLEFSTSRVLATILGKYAQRYDGEVQALPVPSDFPAEIPRIVLQSKDGVFRLDISPTRVTSIWTMVNEVQEQHDYLLNKCVEVLKLYIQENGLQADRLALVLTRVCQNASPAQLLIDQFCKSELKDSIFRQSESFEIHRHKQYQLGSFSTNNWIRCKTAQLVISNELLPAIMIEQDINTLAEEPEPRKFSIDDIQEYFSLAANEADSVLEVFFPS